MELERERGHRPLAFDKMEGLVREMQDPESGVPVRSQKLFLTSIPSAFMGYDLIEWLMERLGIEESEALNIANQLCQYGYFFPVSDSKNLVVKDDSSLYRFQSPYFWPCQTRAPDNVEYAIYLAKRTLRNKQRHGLEEYELESLNNLKKNLANKWDFISMQAEEQVRLAKERKKGDKIVSDSQERAYWRVYRPPPGQLSPLEQCPVPNRCRNARPRRRTLDDVKREVEFLKNSLTRTRVKVSVALESMVQYVETYAEYDPLVTSTQPSNPWVSEDLTFWQLNGPLVEVPTEKRVKRWALSMEELVSDPTGLQEFTNYLRKEYSHENIRFWLAVNDLRRSAQSQIQRKVCEIFEEFLAPGAPCEINIDGKTMERVHQELRNPTRFTFDAAAEHVYTLLLKKDCYPRFIRSDHYKSLLAAGVQPLHKKRFFNFGGQTKKKTSTTTAPNPALLQQGAAGASGGSMVSSSCSSSVQQAAGGVGGGGGGSTTSAALARRRGSDRSLSGSAHELAVSGVRDSGRVPHSHSQSNLSDIPYREASTGGGRQQTATAPTTITASTSEDVCPWETLEVRSRKNSAVLESGSSSSDISAAVASVEVSERLRKACGSTRKLSSTSGIMESSQHSSRRPSITRPSVSSLEEGQQSFDSSAATASAPAPSSDSDNNITQQQTTKVFKKAHSLRKSSSIASGSGAPIISVSSVVDETIDDEDESEEVEEQLQESPENNDDPSPKSECIPECTTKAKLTTSTEIAERIPPPGALAPLAEPDGGSPVSERAPDCAISEEPAQATHHEDDQKHTTTTTPKRSDVCPWEDELDMENNTTSFAIGVLAELSPWFAFDA